MRFDKQIRERIRLQHKSDSTADAYVHWFNRYLSFCQANKIGKETKAEVAVEKFLGFLQLAFTALLSGDCMTIEDLIEALERNGQGCGLISDDAGNWAVSTSGMQTVAMNPPEDIRTTFFVKASEWKPTIREALQAYYDDYVADTEPR